MTDSYRGYINLKHVGKSFEPTHKVISPKTIALLKADIRSRGVKLLTFGSLVKVEDFNGNWAQVRINDNDKSNSVSYIPKIHLVKIDYKYKDWISLAENLIGCPYKWGGRSSLGLDCSALLQLTISNTGINLPRDTIEQIKSSYLKEISIDKAIRGDLIFGKGMLQFLLIKIL